MVSCVPLNNEDVLSVSLSIPWEGSKWFQLKDSLWDIALLMPSFDDYLHICLVCADWSHTMMRHRKLWKRPPFPPLTSYFTFDPKKTPSYAPIRHGRPCSTFQPGSRHLVVKTDFSRISFTFSVWVFPETCGWLLADWTCPWQFYFEVTDTLQFCGHLRRELPPGVGGSEPTQGLVTCIGGTITINKWNHLTFTWDRQNELASCYVDGELVSEASPDPMLRTLTGCLEYNGPDLQHNEHVFNQVGWKGDQPDSREFSGGLYNMLIYPKALNSKEVRDLFHGIEPTR